MQEIIGVKFRNASKVYYFDPKDLDIHYNDHVIVETVRGIEFGTVVLAPMMLADDKVPQPLREVLRIADAQDVERETENRIKEKEAFKICRQKILERGLEMKLIQAEYTFDNSKVLFYFTRIWRAYSARGSSCVRSVSVTRRRSSEGSGSAVGRSAAIHT